MSNDALTSVIKNLRDAAERAGIDPKRGLGEELFHYASTLLPIVNVDLFIVHPERGILLSWRDDAVTGRGWHIPGSCLRYRETLHQRVLRAAEEELGCAVAHDEAPFLVEEFLASAEREGLPNQDVRAHHIALGYVCRLPEDYRVEAFNAGKRETEQGYLRWHRGAPDDLLKMQERYRLVINKLCSERA